MMQRHVSFGNPAMLVRHGLAKIAMQFAAKFDEAVQARVQDDMDGMLDIGEHHGYADHALDFEREGFGMPDLFTCSVRITGHVYATATGRLYMSRDGIHAHGELHVGEGDDLFVIDGTVEEAANNLAAAALEELAAELARDESRPGSLSDEARQRLIAISEVTTQG